MNKEQHKRLTFDDILARKLQREQDKMKIMTIYIPSMNGELIFNSLPEHKILEILDDNEDESRTENIETARKLIYMSCKDLQSPELHKLLEISDPIDVVRTVFTVKETSDIGAELLKFNGIVSDDDNKILSNVKNS